MDNDRLVRDTVPEYHSGNPVIRGLFTRRLDVAFELGALGGGAALDVLDLGCGPGLLLELCREKFPKHRYSGWDYHEDVLKLSMPGVDFKRVDLMKPETLPKRRFDRVFCLDVLEHIAELPPVLESLKGLLKPDGLFVISEPTESLLYRLGRLLSKGTMSSMDGPTGTPHYFNAAQIHEMFLKAGYVSHAQRMIPPWPIDLFHITQYGLK
jgi:2-polyprenyl-3-methyl-5-hydroxy-6-metoxy-1,4-benzoquinol methylase